MLSVDFRNHIIPLYDDIKNYISSPCHPLAIFMADICEAIKNPRKSIIIISPQLVFIAFEKTIKHHKFGKINTILVRFATGNISMLQPHIQSYLNNPKNTIHHVYYFHADKWRLVPIKRFIKHSSSSQA